MYLFSTIDVVHTRMKIYTRIEFPVYKLIHIINYTCLKPYVLQIICVLNHTHYKSYTLQIIRVWNDGIWLDDQRHTPALQIICVWNHTHYKSYTLQIIGVRNEGIWLGDQRHTPALSYLALVSRHDGDGLLWLKASFITWFAVHCFSIMHCTQCIVQYNALSKTVVCDHPRRF